MHCVFFFLSGSCEDMGIFHVFQISFDDLMISTHNSEKNPHIFKTTNQKKKISTVHNLIKFSIVITNKTRSF